MSRPFDFLMSHVMALLIEVRNIVVHSLRKTSRSSPSGSCWMVVSALRPFGRVLRALLTLCAPAA